MDTRELERELRRNQDTLSSVGLGVLAFGIWSVIKAAILFVIQVPAQIKATAEAQYVPAAIAVAGAFLLLLLGVILALRVFIWRSARAEWREGRHKSGYLFAVGFLAAVSLTSLIGMILTLALPDQLKSDGSGDIFMAAVIELTSLITLIEMIAASIRVKKLTRELENRRG